jgi:ribonuclease P protein component
VASGARFEPSARLRKPAEFKLVFTEGQRVKRQLLAASFRPNQGEQARLGLAIAKKAVASACARNRIKRLIRENFRQNRSRLPAVDFVFYVQPGVADLSNTLLRDVLAEIWTKVIERCARYSSPPSASIKAR